MSDDTALQKPKNLEEIMREKVRLIFADMIPDETLDAMITDEWQRFAKGDKDRYGNREKLSDLDKIIREAVGGWAKKELAPRINARINQAMQEHWQVQNGQKTWDDVVDEALKKLVKDIGQTMVEFILSNFSAQVMQGVQQSISSMMSNRGY